MFTVLCILVIVNVILYSMDLLASDNLVISATYDRCAVRIFLYQFL